MLRGRREKSTRVTTKAQVPPLCSCMASRITLHIWDDLVPYLIASGRRVVTFDFLGFGASDKPAEVPTVSSSNWPISKRW